MTNGIWKYTDKYIQSPLEFNQLTLDEGNTPIDTFTARQLDNMSFENVFLKREDLNPSGSHKDRYIAYSLSNAIDFENTLEFVISSSGNAAISAIHFFRKFQNKGIKLYVMVSNKLKETKLSRLITAIPQLEESIINHFDCAYENINIQFSHTPLSDSIKFANTNGYKLLRGSTDIYGSEGYKSIAFEICDYFNSNPNFPFPDAIFIPTSSGSTVQGIFEGFEDIKKEKENFQIPRFFILQTTYINTISKLYDKNFISSDSSIASAIVDRVAHRKSEINRIIMQTNGSAFTLSDSEIEKGIQIFQENKIVCSPEGAMTLAGIIRASKSSLNISNPLCIITGVR